MKILLLTQVLPYPPDSGPKVKTWNVLKYIAKNHDVTLVSFIRGDQSQDIDKLKDFCSGGVYTVPMKRSLHTEIFALFQSLRSKNPWLIERDGRKEMQLLVDRLASQYSFDIIHADQLNMAQYAIRVQDSKRVLDAHNALWLLYQRLWKTMRPGPKKWLLNRDWRLMKRYEGIMCRLFEAVLTVSNEDKHALKETINETLNIEVIPIAVDTEEVPPIIRDSPNGHIVYIGTMYWPPNIDGVRWFINEVFPIIREARSDAVFDVIGARPPKNLVRLNNKDYGVNVTGYIEDPSVYLERAGVMVVPLRAGGGMRVKILNALSQGLPIVTTKIGCEGIAVKSGNHLLVADSSYDFAQATLSLLNDQVMAKELGNNGRRLVEEQYDYRIACRPLDRIYTEI